MTNPEASDHQIRFKVGLFVILGLLLTGAVTVFVNDKPFWWRPCQLVKINIEDATGIKIKSPVRSLGIQIGYIQRVELTESHVTLHICLTAPIEVLPSTRAYVRPEGFLGDQFVELKPVRNLNSDQANPSQTNKSSWLEWLIPEAHAEDVKPSSREVPVGEQSHNIERVVNRVDGLVGELTSLATNLKRAINPEELRETMRQLNKTLENAAKTLSPEGNLTTTAQRALAKLEESIEQLRDILTRINQGQGSVGRIINDPVYADELVKALKNLNFLLNKTSDVRFVMNAGAERLNGYDGTRGFFQLAIWPNLDRYYLLGVSSDPRGSIKSTTTTTSVGSVSTTTTTTESESDSILFTAMLGKVLFKRIDLSAGLLHGDGALRVKFNLGLNESEDRLSLGLDTYSRRQNGTSFQIHERVQLTIFPSKSPYLSSIYIDGGIETHRKVNGKVAWSYGAGIRFDDNDIKILFAFL